MCMQYSGHTHVWAYFSIHLFHFLVLRCLLAFTATPQLNFYTYNGNGKLGWDKQRSSSYNYQKKNSENTSFCCRRVESQSHTIDFLPSVHVHVSGFKSSHLAGSEYGCQICFDVGMSATANRISPIYIWLPGFNINQVSNWIIRCMYTMYAVLIHTCTVQIRNHELETNFKIGIQFQGCTAQFGNVGIQYVEERPHVSMTSIRDTRTDYQCQRQFQLACYTYMYLLPPWDQRMCFFPLCHLKPAKHELTF